MSTKNILLAVDTALTYINAASRIGQTISQARAEDRDITDEELDALVAQSAELRDGWDRAGQ